jgi:uncharacterized membrane protein YheB (UPF0754 family)
MLNSYILIALPVASGIISYFSIEIAVSLLLPESFIRHFQQEAISVKPDLENTLLVDVEEEILKDLLSHNIVLTLEEVKTIFRWLIDINSLEQATKIFLAAILTEIKLNSYSSDRSPLINIFEDLIKESFPQILKAWVDRENFLEIQFDYLFDQILLDLSFNEFQANQLAEWLLTEGLPPERLRQIIIETLSDDNIQAIDEIARRNSSGTYWVVANTVGLKTPLVNLRKFCINEKDLIGSRGIELFVALNIKKRLVKLLISLSLRKLPDVSTQKIRQLLQERYRFTGFSQRDWLSGWQ